MSTELYVKRDTAPLLAAGDEVLVISRHRGAITAPPRFFVVALDSGTQFETSSGKGLQVDDFTATPSSVLGRGQRTSVSMVNAVNADNNIYVLRCLSGRLAVTIVSPHELQMQFRSLGRRRV